MHETRIIKGRKQALGEAYSKALSAKHSFYCITGEELAKSYKPFIPLLQARIKNGGSSTIITSIDKSTIQAVKELTSAGSQIRHTKPSELRRCVIYDDSVAYFSVVEPTVTREAVDSVDQTEGDDLWVSSTEPAVIQSAKKRFEADWKNALPAQNRINELEKGEQIETIRVIRENKEAVDIYKSMAAKMRTEALYLLPTSRALVRMKKAGLIDLLISAAKDIGAKVRILCPIDSENIDIVEYLERQSRDIEIREHEPTMSTVLIVDREQLFTSELRNNDTFDIYEALSLSVYSNSRPTIDSHVALFESLWKQKELYNELERSTTELELANSQLKIHDKMQQEFINIAAHELRTPIQPILGMADVLNAQFEKNKREQKDTIELSQQDLELIVRNARRLEKLSSNILEIARIESASLKLNTNEVNLKDIIDTAVHDAQNNIDKSAIQFVYNAISDIFVKADKERIRQVIDNLIGNAIKFTKAGTISITVRMRENETGKSALVSVKDTGSGIDPEILPRLFTKFATKSDKGTGLGLFISKGIIEAHGGRIWAENNGDGRGATFSFSIPAS